MKFKDNTPGTETNYNTRQDSNQMLEEMLRDLCIPGATWKLGSGQPPQPIQLRRKELQPLARGWLEFVTHNIHPSSNRSEVTVAKAILIHSIIKGEDVRVEELISARIANIAQNLKLKGKLGFPSLIYKLCKEAKVFFEEYKRNACVNEESTITAKVIETVRGGALPILRRHQEEAGHDEDQHHDEDQVMHEAGHDEDQDQDFQQQQQQGFKAIIDLITDMKLETLNYFENMKQNQENQFDQMKAIIAQQQEIIANQNREFQAMGQKQDQLEKELSEIRRAQVNLAMYKSSSSSQMTTTMAASSEEKLDQIASSIEAFREELKIFKGRNEELANLSYAQYSKTRKEQAALSKEIKEIREHLISSTTEHPTTSANNETLMDIARMTYQQREELKQIRKQMREWTIYSSARECYDVWAHQQANPNLVQMPLHDLTKMVYDNLENKRPMFRGALKTDPNPGQVSRPEPIPPEDLHLYNNQQVSFFEG
ncbi:hypothetical protein PIB30_093445 [Stylosanthes scabra]|uniref:Putative plant transposon protein domain-containing protein n=1 Tax=Stylosanthes scabra TaxID=79078 RepID=A0ABU6QVA6_9FABA|nr:hypothetical protein [Stylosanthes scabra]